MTKHIIPLLIAAMLLVMGTGCARLDVVGNMSVESFSAILASVPADVSSNEAIAGWTLAAPDGTASFSWSGDYSQSPMFDIMVSFDATPFLAAGLDPQKLPESHIYSDGLLTVGKKLGSEQLIYQGERTPLAGYARIVDKYRPVIGYHMGMDHYNIDLGGGNMFEWAKDMSINTVNKSAQDKDMVFVLDPAPFIAAGVDPENVNGWAYAKVSVHTGGKPTEVYKVLKAFDLA